MKTYDHRKISQIYKKKTLNILSLKSNYIKDFCSSKGIQRKRTTNWKILITYIKDQHPNYKEKFYKLVKYPTGQKIWAKDISLAYFYQKHSTYIKRCSITLKIREMQTQTTMSQPFITSLNITNISQNADDQKHCSHTMRVQNDTTTTLRNILALSWKVEHLCTPRFNKFSPREIFRESFTYMQPLYVYDPQSISSHISSMTIPSF